MTMTNADARKRIMRVHPHYELLLRKIKIDIITIITYLYKFQIRVLGKTLREVR